MRGGLVFVAASVVVALAAGCGGASTAGQDVRSDSVDVALDAGADVEASSDVLGKDPGGGADDVGADLVEVVDVPDDETAPNPCGFGPTFGHTCESNNDCNGGWCITTKDGYACTEACVDCCPAGWQCKEIPAGADKVFACAPDHVTLCRPCTVDATCNGVGYQPGAFCRALPEPPAPSEAVRGRAEGDATATRGAFCATPCSAGAPCPAGYECQALADAPTPGATYCVPQAGECACDQVAVTQGLTTTCSRTTAFGTCPGRRACGAAGAEVAACDAPEAVLEACNGGDDDCDGLTDEGLADQPDACTVPGATGECARGALRCADGGWACVAMGAGTDELCDGLDNDCDGLTDEDGADDCVDYYVDGDHDLFGTSALVRCACARPDGFAATAGDCDDAHATARPGGTESCDGLDNDCDGGTDGPATDVACSATCGDGARPCVGGVLQGCTAPGTHACTDYAVCASFDTCDACPAAPAEACNGVDDDCDGLTDAADPDLLLLPGSPDDPDGGGGEGAPPCEAQAGVCAGATKPAALCVGGAWSPCDAAAYQAHAVQYQAVAEASCDGQDNDCDGATDDEFAWAGPDAVVVVGPGKPCGAGACAGGTTACAASGIALTCAGGGLGGPETCNGVDDDCDAKTDADDPDLVLVACDVQAGVCAGATRPPALCSRSGDGWLPCGAAEYAAHAAAYQAGGEALCDGRDNDCDGATDEGLTTTFFRDADHDGYGALTSPVEACAAPDGAVTNALDCDDGDGGVHPGGTEGCNAKDDDCDGVTDGLKAPCTNGCEQAEISCLAGTWSACGASSPLSCLAFDTCTYKPLCAGACPAAPAETCNGTDDDCDGATDEGQGETACGQGACAHVSPNCANGAPQACDPLLGKTDEACNGQDDDCDGATDEGLGALSCGLGACAHTVPACLGGLAQACDPLQGTTAETCNGQDDDCDGTPDDGNPGGGLACTVPGAKGVCAAGVTRCTGGGIVCDQVAFGSTEICDGQDNDCDGVIDGLTRACTNGCNWGNEACGNGSWTPCDAAPPQCTTGPCCDGCTFRTNDTLCDLLPATTEFRCTAASRCGGDVETQEWYRFCTGASAACNDQNLQSTGWFAIDTCAPDQPCGVTATSGACGDSCPLGCTNGECQAAPCPVGGCEVEGPTPYFKDAVVALVGGCTTDPGWHTGPAGSTALWTWASRCAVPPVGAYGGYSVRWQFYVGTYGIVNIVVDIPPTSEVCTLQGVDPTNRYADGVFYQLDGPNGYSSTSNAVFPSTLKGSSKALQFSTATLEAGTYTLTLFDRSNSASAYGCFDASAWSTRWIFADQVKVTAF